MSLCRESDTTMLTSTHSSIHSFIHSYVRTSVRWIDQWENISNLLSFFQHPSFFCRDLVDFCMSVETLTVHDIGVIIVRKLDMSVHCQR